MNLIEMETYTIIYMTQISLTLGCLVLLLIYLQRKIEFLNEMSGNTFVEENISLRRTVFGFVFSFTFRIVLTLF